MPTQQVFCGPLPAARTPRGGCGRRKRRGRAARSTRRAVCAHVPRRGTRAATACEQPHVAAPGCEGGARREHLAARGSTTAADAGVGGQNLFSSQAGSGTRPAGEASSSGTAPQGRSEADIGKDAARRQQKREGGRSSAERMMFASRGGCGSPSNCGASHGGRAAHLVEETTERLDYGCVREQSSIPIPKQLAHASWGMVANREELYMHVHFQYLHSLVRNEHIARIRRPHMAHNAAPTALLSILRRWLTTLLSHQEACSAPRYTYPRVRASAPRARALAPRRPPW